MITIASLRRFAVTALATALFATAALAGTTDKFFASLNASINQLPTLERDDLDDSGRSWRPTIQPTSSTSAKSKSGASSYERRYRDYYRMGRADSGSDNWREALRAYRSGLLTEAEVGDLRRLSVQLQQRIAAKQVAPSPTYWNTLLHDLQLIRSAARPENAFDRRLMLADAKADLEVKLHYAGTTPASGGYWVELSVSTRRRGRAVDGYQVGVVPMRWQGSEPWFLLPKISSPAKGEVAPGRYQLVVKDGGRELARQVFLIGAAGRTAEHVDVAIP